MERSPEGIHHGQRYLQHKICEVDCVGGNIFHFSYLYQKFHVARYLVETFPQWAYLPLTTGYELGYCNNPDIKIHVSNIHLLTYIYIY